MSKKKSQKKTISLVDNETVDSATQKLAEILVQHIDERGDKPVEKSNTH
ncbi:MAG: hypothetical protein NT077_01240 [Candidatus Taylorbacteria bacterium]|nr:hypothetical protein [Candidatus Taylorbacteria bacterium]